MPDLRTLSPGDLREHRDLFRERNAAFRERGLDLNMTRGKPSEAQLDLADRLLKLPGAGDYRAADGGDCRNYYGSLQGLPEARSAEGIATCALLAATEALLARQEKGSISIAAPAV